MTENSFKNNSGMIKKTSLETALSERYLSYALSTITARSLPDVRDGLKPVQRRILYAMKESGNTHDKSFKKSASAVGYVMMRYHPHGNDPIYEAMVRLAQDFSTRYLLVDGQGNFGSLDGDNAAAMRYTEARLTLASAALLEGIDEDAVDFQETYNAETQEPKVLPASFPNLLANGATGIAVGMATNIPPHNLGEICQALLFLIRHPECTTKDLMKSIQGPDFPTGGIIFEDAESLIKTYETGRGSFRLRARYTVEDLKSGLYQIVITEIPYQVQKGKLIERIATLIIEKKIPFLADIRDESAVDVRLILIPRNRTVSPEILMEALYHFSDLEIRFNLNMNVLDQGRFPKVMSLKNVLRAFLIHRQSVLCRRATFRLDQIAKRLEILQGYHIAYLNLDEVIQIIRTEDNPKEKLISRWMLSDIQAEAILNMRLRALHKLQEIQILQERQSLEDEQKKLQSLIRNEDQQWLKIAEEIKKIRKGFGSDTQIGKRRTTFGVLSVSDINILDAMVEKESVKIVCSQKGWIRTHKDYHVQSGEFKYKEGDQERFVLSGETTDKLMIFATNGRMYTIGVDKLPGGRGHGEPIRLMIDLPDDEDSVSMFIMTSKMIEDEFLLVSKAGYGFLIKGTNLLAQTKTGKQVMNLGKGDQTFACIPALGDHVAMIGTHRKLLVFDLKQIPELTKGRGVILQRYQEGCVADVKVFEAAQGLSWQLGERTRVEKDLRPWLGERAQRGKLPPVGFPRGNHF